MASRLEKLSTQEYVDLYHKALRYIETHPTDGRPIEDIMEDLHFNVTPPAEFLQSCSEAAYADEAARIINKFRLQRGN